MKLFPRSAIERHTVERDLITDFRNAVLEDDRILTIAIRLEELPKLLGQHGVADTTCLHLRRPCRTILNVGADLRRIESDAPRLKTITAAQLTEGGSAYASSLIVEFGDMRQDQPAGNQRINDRAISRQFQSA